MPNTLIWIPKRLVELGLVNVAARSPEAFIDYCEQDYAARVEHAAACVRESGAHVVMLTGPSASGKTTTAHKLADCIAAHGRRSAVVSLDNFYKDLMHTLTLKRASNLVIEHAPNAYGDVARMLDSCALLGENGYEPYYLYRQKGTLQNLENTGYTRPGYAGLYNVFIMEEVHTILSAGAGGSTKLVGPDGHIRRIFNHKYPLEYIERFDVVQARKQGVDDFYAKYADLDPETAR